MRGTALDPGAELLYSLRFLEIVLFPATRPLPLRHSSAIALSPQGRQDITRTSPQSVVLHVLRAVGEPAWAPAQAAEHLLQQVDDALVLRRARALLRVVTRARINPAHARAFATITLALDRLEDHRHTPSITTPTCGAHGVRP